MNQLNIICIILLIIILISAAVTLLQKITVTETLSKHKIKKPTYARKRNYGYFDHKLNNFDDYDDDNNCERRNNFKKQHYNAYDLFNQMGDQDDLDVDDKLNDFIHHENKYDDEYIGDVYDYLVQ